MAAVLALVVIAGEEVASIEFDALLGKFVVPGQADNAGDCDMEPDGAHPIMAIGFKLFLKLRELGPSHQVIVGK